jgi:hypothetical protein
MYIVCCKVNFITNITNFIEIFTFYFYNNKYRFINISLLFITLKPNKTNILKSKNEKLKFLKLKMNQFPR